MSLGKASRQPRTPAIRQTAGSKRGCCQSSEPPPRIPSRPAADALTPRRFGRRGVLGVSVPMAESAGMKPYRFAPPPERQLPKETDAVVIGGGVVGVTAALLLAEWGVPVVLCEKGWIAGQTAFQGPNETECRGSPKGTVRDTCATISQAPAWLFLQSLRCLHHVQFAT